MSVDNPRDVPAAHAIIRRLCALQALVACDVLGHDDPADCFCGDEGFWPYESAEDYRNAGKAIDFHRDRDAQGRCGMADGEGGDGVTAEPYIPLPPDPPTERTLPAGLYCPRCGHPAPCPNNHEDE